MCWPRDSIIYNGLKVSRGHDFVFVYYVTSISDMHIPLILIVTLKSIQKFFTILSTMHNSHHIYYTNCVSTCVVHSQGVLSP